MNMIAKLMLLILTLLLAMVLIVGCQSFETTNEDLPRLISRDSNLYNNGELYIDNQQRLNFFDFTSMKSTIVCPKPNCPHNGQSDCSSLGMTTCPLIYGNHIYFFDNEIQYGNDGKPIWITALYKANIDGTNRIKINSFENYQLMYYDRLILCGGMLYFAPLIVGYEENGISSNLLGAKLCSYSFAENKVNELYDLGKGYGFNTYLWGESNGDIYVEVSYREDEISFDELMDLLMNTDENIYTHVNYKYDIENNSLSESDPNYKPMLGGYLCHFEDNGVTLYLPSGELFVDDMTNDMYDIYDIMAAGDYIFDVDDMLAININTGEKYSLLIDDGADFIYYVDGYYILKKLNRDSGIYEYEQVSETELIGINHVE